MATRDNRLHSGERQVAATVDGIRTDHVARYQLAAEYASNRKVLDLGCGCGYGSWLLGGVASAVLGIDVSAESIAFARQHYAMLHPHFVSFICYDLDNPPDYGMGEWGVICAFEVLEHVQQDKALLERAYQWLAPEGTLLVSAPNRNIWPDHTANRFHLRHYTPVEFAELLTDCGFVIERSLTQINKAQPAIIEGFHGTVLLAVCRKG